MKRVPFICQISSIMTHDIDSMISTLLC